MQDDFLLQAYDYELPEKHIAQNPAERRDHSKLLVYDRKRSSIQHHQFSDIINYLVPGDVLVANDTRVFPARLTGRKETGGKVEVFLLAYPQPHTEASNKKPYNHFSCEALIKSSRPPKPGAKIMITSESYCTPLRYLGRGRWAVTLAIPKSVTLDAVLSSCGTVPLPPYINRAQGTQINDSFRYQTVYAEKIGAVAAPTAGLHFTEELLLELELKEIAVTTITLHVGYGTFSPVESADITQHTIHQEQVVVSKQSAEIINRAKAAGGRVWAVGTTTVRTLEACVDSRGEVHPFYGWCDLFITPGFSYRIIDNLITNFHLPRSSLMFLVAALCGREALLNCYQTAIEKDYRFYSYGDAMAII